MQKFLVTDEIRSTHHKYCWKAPAQKMIKRNNLVGKPPLAQCDQEPSVVGDRTHPGERGKIKIN